MKEVILNYINQMKIEENEGLALVGSHANGSDKKWSDVDLIVLTDHPRQGRIDLFCDQYFTITYYTKEALEDYFIDVEKMLVGLNAFSQMKILIDPEDELKSFSHKCKNFRLTSVHLEHLKYKAKLEYISYIEEAQKALQGLSDNHQGKMILGLYGLTFGMFRVIALKEGLMQASENDFYDIVMNHLEDRDPIKDIAPHAFGIDRTDLVDQVEAGLELFMHVGNSLMSLFDEDEKKYGLKLIQEIIKVV